MTTERKSHHPLEGGSRISAYAFSTPELTLIGDPHDPLYDHRIETRKLTREFLLSIAMRGVETPISVRRRGKDNVVIRGKQRTKGVIVVNALCPGIPYTGPVKSIHEAIREFGADQDFVKKVTEWVTKALKIRAVPANAGDERDARMSMRVENSMRYGDVREETIRAAKAEHEKYGTSAEDIATSEGVSVATARRWLATDLSAPKGSKKRSKHGRPTNKQIRNFAEQVQAHLTPREAALLDWIATGKSSGKNIAELFLGIAREPVAHVRDADAAGARAARRRHPPTAAPARRCESGTRCRAAGTKWRSGC